MRKRAKVAILTCVALPLASLAKGSDKVNIVYILADDMGYGDVSALNSSSKANTTNIDAMAREGMIFSDAHSPSAVSTPTRYGVLTGRYAWRTSMQSGVLWSFDDPLIDKSRPTVASMLQNNGYNTACIGKWHLGLGWQRTSAQKDDVDYSRPLKESPNDNGFGYSYIITASLDIPPYVYIENGNFTELPTRRTSREGKGFWRDGATGATFDHERVLEHFTDKAVDYIAKSAKEDKPFFLYLPLTAPHTPILPTEEFLGKSGAGLYTDFVLAVDHTVGRINRALKDAGVEGNTIVIFTADNGCSTAADIGELASMGHYPSYIYRGQKADIYEGGHRVPFIVKYPGVVAAGSTSSYLTTLTNLMATSADIVGVKLQETEAEDSFSILPVLKGKYAPQRAIINHSIDGNFAIRSSEWKLCVTPGSGGWSAPTRGKEPQGAPLMQLFNLKENPSEHSAANLIDVYPKQAERLFEELVNIVERGTSRPGSIQKNDVEVKIIK